jgi:hypothetical protein
LLSKLNPLFPKICTLPVWKKVKEILVIFQDTVHIITAGGSINNLSISVFGSLHDLQGDLEVIIFTLICGENQGANSTGFEQLTLKVSDNPLAHG